VRPIRSRIARALCVVCAAAVALPASAGTLGDFEGAATTPKPGPAPAPRSGSVGSNAGHAGGGVRIDNSLTGLQSGDLVVLVAIGLVAGAQLSLGRMQGAPSVAGIRTTPRARGDPDLPMLRLDANHQNVQGDVRAGDFRLETGYGPLAVQARYHPVPRGHPAGHPRSHVRTRARAHLRDVRVRTRRRRRFGVALWQRASQRILGDGRDGVASARARRAALRTGVVVHPGPLDP
jgi:hypothetical protein